MIRIAACLVIWAAVDTAAAQAPQYQPNSAACSLDVDGMMSSANRPMVLTSCVNTMHTLNFSTTNAGMLWQYLYAFSLPIGPSATTGLVTPGGNVVNIPLSGLSFLFTPPGAPNAPASFAIPFSYAAPFRGSGQAGVADPTHFDGFVLSAAHTLAIFDAGAQFTFPGPSGDNDSMEVLIPPCLPPIDFPILVADPVTGQPTSTPTFWTSFWVNTNGSVSFGSPVSDFTPSTLEFLQDPPRVAGMWSDLDPDLGGSISVRLDSNAMEVTYANVAEAGSAAAQSSVVLRFSVGPSKTVFISQYAPSAAHTSASLVGITPGALATFPSIPTANPVTGVDFSAHIGIGGTSAPTDAVFEFNPGGAVIGGWSDLVWPDANGSFWCVN